VVIVNDNSNNGGLLFVYVIGWKSEDWNERWLLRPTYLVYTLGLL